MRISDWSSDVCSSDLFKRFGECTEPARKHRHRPRAQQEMHLAKREIVELQAERRRDERVRQLLVREHDVQPDGRRAGIIRDRKSTRLNLQSLMRISYAVLGMKKKKITRI